MNKIFSCLLLLAVSHNLHAQLVIPTDIIAQPGDYFAVQFAENPEIIDPGGSGINQVWDMTSVEINSNLFIVHETMVAADTPYDTIFPSSNLVDRYYSNDEPGDYTYKYFFLNDTTLDYYSLGTKGTQLMFTYTNPQMIFHFPFGFNNTSSDNFCFSSDILGTTYNYCGNSSILFDGVGTLKLPYGNFFSVYRFKYYDEIVEAGSPNDTTKNTKYYWYKSGIHYPLLTYDIFQASNGNTFVSANMLSESSANAVKNTESTVDVNVYPNPTTDYLFIDATPFINSDNDLTIISADGRVVKKEMISRSPMQKVDVSDLSPGVYTLVIRGNNKLAHKMIVKI